MSDRSVPNPHLAGARLAVPRLVLLRLAIGCAAALALSSCAGRSGPRHGPSRWHPPVNMLLKYDTNRDGTITRAELIAGMRADFDAADLNHDGRLDEDEVRAVNEARWTKDASASSPLVDWNHDGYVDFEEFAGTPLSLFAELDTNGDNRLSPAELKAGRAGPRPPKSPSESGRHRGQDRGRGGGDEGGGGDSDGD